MKKLLALILSLIMVLSLAACGGDTTDDTGDTDTGNTDTGDTDTGDTDTGDAAGAIQIAKEDLKVAIVLPGTVNDAGWTASAYEGILAIEESYGCETSYMESIPVTNAEEVFRNYANSGYNVIFGHGSEYYDAAAAVAEEFPEIAFIVTSTD